MSRHAKQDLWESAVPLAEAWHVFATPKHRATFDGMNGFIEKFTEISTTTPEVGVWNALSVGLKSKADRDALIREMQEDLLDGLFNSELLGGVDKLAHPQAD